MSYSKVRALTRVAQLHDEDLLLAYALEARSPQVEERCRQIRNVAPESAHDARRAWERRSLTMWRDEARGTDAAHRRSADRGGRADRAGARPRGGAGEVTTDIDPDAVAESKGTAWRAQQADALVAVVKSYLDGGDAARAARRRITIKSSCMRTRNPSREGRDARICRSTRSSGCSAIAAWWLVVEDANGNPLDVGRKQRTVSTPLQARAAMRATAAARSRAVIASGISTGTILKHWVNGGETKPDNMTLLCTHHHRLLHEGGFGIVKEADGTLRFVTADGRTIPRNGYRLEDFVDDDVGDNEAWTKSLT